MESAAKSRQGRGRFTFLAGNFDVGGPTGSVKGGMPNIIGAIPQVHHVSPPTKKGHSGAGLTFLVRNLDVACPRHCNPPSLSPMKGLVIKPL